jgi:RRXRR protein/HNH endonuclease
MRIFVLDKNKQPLMPCHPARARQLLAKGKAAVFRQAPFTLILLEREGGVCQDLSLQIDHILPKRLGGTDRVDNLAICCRSCNQKKGTLTLHAFLKDPLKVDHILSLSKKTLKDAAAVNASRKVIGEVLVPLGKKVSFWSGAQTKCNRVKQCLAKEHWIDAACVGHLETRLIIPERTSVLEITATGRGSRQQCLVNRFGFPRSAGKQKKRVLDFQTGDLVHAGVPSGKKQGHYRGRVAVRATGNFNIKTPCGIFEGIHARYCRLSQRADGYSYTYFNGSSASSPA